jgi:hypothetical protein
MKITPPSSEPQNKKSAARKKSCAAIVRDLKLVAFRLSDDGPEWRKVAGTRWDFLLRLATYANPSGTFLSPDRKINFSPSAKTLQQRYTEPTFYRLRNDLVVLGFLSSERANRHSRCTYQIHVPPKLRPKTSQSGPLMHDRSEKIGTSHAREFGTSHARESKRVEFSPQSKQKTELNPSEGVPHPSLKNLPYVAVTGGSRAAAASCTNTPPKKDASATLSAFLAFGFDHPFGHPRFQEAVLRNSAEIKNGNQLEVMENIIVELNGRVPPLWYAAKHSLEETLQSAAVRSEAQVGSPRHSRNAEPFSKNELENYCARNAAAIERAATRFPAIAERLREIAQSLSGCVAAAYPEGKCDLDSLERKLTVLEEAISALLEKEASDEQMSPIRPEMDRSLGPYRAKMSREQISQLERQYLQKRVFELFEIPRLSLFYLT